MSRIRLGDMLVQAQMVTAEHVDEALALQKTRGGRLGELLVELGYVSEVQLAQVLSNQLSIPWVNLYHVDFSRELLNLIPAELAEKYGCVPVYVRKIRKQGDTLFVATDDPTNETALIAIAQQAGMPVKPMVASSSDVRNAIRVYYFGGRETAATAPIVKRKAPSIAAPPPVVTRSSIAPVELDEAELEPSIPKAPAVPTEVAAPEPAPPAAPSPEPAVPAAPARPAPAKKPRTITLTLLDGTTVKLPASGKKKPEEQAPQESLTTRDLIAALQARAEGKDVSAVLPDARWEPLFAALLSLLLRKGLIADWEFVEEWSKHRR
ncbi:hypothetical protein [Sandaracinus amylolyticus]|uniref:Type IV fimbrial assembly, ATPase PilB n=1 Tax=Sandaracinus amylolyticus TaxID=927083 RepID=A0A0F6WA82_9BACT|nr:hypothetical protein [Sandaracinus amylolyticus]AKF11400.1 Type IV fimbrial assembly, ATPase PilB [Sandaracinus amylolyticus]